MKASPDLLFGVVETVRIRDKKVEGGVRIVNFHDVTDNDVIVDTKPTGKPGEKTPE